MLAVVLKILYVIGMILLSILGILLILLLLVLFFPVFYRIDGRKKPDGLYACVRAHWLFGLVRVKFAYPDPGSLTVRLLFFKAFDSSSQKASENTTEKKNLSLVSNDAGGDMRGGEKDEEKESCSRDNGSIPADSNISSENNDADCGEISGDETNGKKLFSGLYAKYKKLEYTIEKFYDKIKGIFENIDFYRRLLDEENTRALLRYAFLRICRILKSIRPRRLKADIVFGAATPDVTGYVYGIYGMLTPSLGQSFYLVPDFTRQVLEGELYASGHITVFTILINSAMVLFDRRLRILLRKLKKHSSGKNKDRDKTQD
ncbi:MAG: hypothetical protein LUG83_09310 [Lachnospiraceae bacterium]|nr:hypothetical protein [Lachnospiraceae bacterium]